jgi:hypothetical protein
MGQICIRTEVGRAQIRILYPTRVLSVGYLELTHSFLLAHITHQRQTLNP